MFGFIIGTLSLIGLIKVWKYRRWGGGWGHHSRGGPRRWMLRRLFERLDTTPGQEKVILEAIDEVERAGLQARNGFMGMRSSLANAMRGEQFDTAAARATLDEQQASIDEVKKAALAGMQKIHEALNPEQRKQLGDLFEFGPYALHGGHGHGCHGGWGRHSHGMRHGGGPVHI